jgi:RNA polymerase sigma-70 factor (ECF subfamily)
MLEAARAGDRAAFGQLVEKYRSYLRAVAASVLGDRLPSDGSDVVQAGLGLAWERLSQFQGRKPAEFLGWLRTIVHREALRLLRKAGRLKPLADSPSGDQLAGDSSGPDVKADRRLQAARLLAAIQRLPEDYQTVIDLRHFKGLPFEDVARCMGRTSEAVRKLWTRAIDRLRQELGDQP